MKKTKIMMLCGMAAVLASCGGGSDGYVTNGDLEYIPMRNGYDVWVYVNPRDGKEYTELGSFIEASLFYDGIARVFDPAFGIWYINKDGSKLNDSVYESASVFSEGLAWVSPKKKPLRVIDTNGETKFEFKQAEAACPFYGGRAVYVDAAGLYGIVDKDGEVVVAPKWKSAIPVVVDGLIAAKDDQGWSLVKEDGEVLLSGMSQIGVDDNELSTMLSDYMGGDNISFTRDYIQAIKQGRIRVCNSAGQWGIVDKEGKYVINPQFDDIIADGDGYLFEKGKQWGWCDAEGRYVINPQFRDALSFDGHDLAGARDSGGKWGLIDRDGKWTVNPQFGKIGKFLPNGNIIAQDASSKDWGIIDEEGKWVVNPQFLRIVYIGEDDLLGVVDHEYSFGFIGLDGKYICNLNQYSALSDEIVCKAIGMGGIYIAHSDYVDVEAYVNAISNELTALNITTAGELKQEYDMKESAFPKWGGSTVVYKKKVMPGLTMEVTVPKLNAWNRVRKGWSYNYVFNPDEWVYKYTVKIQFDDYGKMRSQYTDIMHVLNDKFKYDREKDTYTIPGCDYATIKESPVNGLYTINMEFEIATD